MNHGRMLAHFLARGMSKDEAEREARQARINMSGNGRAVCSLPGRPLSARRSAPATVANHHTTRDDGEGKTNAVQG